ncbi:MAG: nitrophenyl compound nitroreductase subunit ArsF family protein [Candidatus Omnitrophota bacterium]
MAIRNRALSIVFFFFVLAIVLFSIMGFAAENKVIAYYFHGSFRCPTCHKLEQYSKEAIEENFKDEIANGALEFKTINVEKEGNEHFVNDYQLYTKSLVISKIEEGKEAQHKNLEKIWEYVRNKEKFFDYVTSEIKGYLGK